MKKLNFNQLSEVKTPEKWMEKALDIPDKKHTPFLFSRRLTTSAVVAAVMMMSVALLVVFGTRNNPPTASPQPSTQQETQILTDPQGNTYVVTIEPTTGGNVITNPFAPIPTDSSGLLPGGIQYSTVPHHSQGTTQNGTAPQSATQGTTSQNGSTPPQQGTQGTQKPTDATQHSTQAPTAPQITDPVLSTEGDDPTIQSNTQPPTNPPWWGNPTEPPWDIIPTEEPCTKPPHLEGDPSDSNKNNTLKAGDAFIISFTQKVNKYFSSKDTLYCHIICGGQTVSSNAVMSKISSTSYSATVTMNKTCEKSKCAVVFYTSDGSKLTYSLNGINLNSISFTI